MTGVVLEAGNLRFGGGVQVAASFLDEVAALKREPPCGRRYPWLDDVRVVASPEVLANVDPNLIDALRVTRMVRKHSPIKSILRLARPGTLTRSSWCSVLCTPADRPPSKSWDSRMSPHCTAARQASMKLARQP